jgi:energy-coupling factor transporter ATP-binding protein EcfA2
MTVFQNVYTTALLRNPNLPFNRASQAALDALKKMRLIPHKDKFIREISGGQRKRVNIAMELACHPSLVLMDEPTSGLDSFTSLAIIDDLKKQCQESNLSIAMVIHQPREEIFWKFDHLVVIHKKQTLFSSSIKNLPVELKTKSSEDGIHTNPADALMDYLETKASEEGKLEFMQDDVMVAKKQKNEGFPVRNNAVGFWRQFLSQVYRSFIIEFNSKGDFLVSLLSTAGSGLLAGALFSSPLIEKASVLVFMCNLTSQVLAAVNAVKIFGRNDEKLMYERESHAGVSRIAYFLSKTVIDIVFTFVYSILYIILFFAFGMPRASFYQYFIVVLLGQFTARPLAHLVSLHVPADSAALAVVVTALVFNFTCGFQPTISALKQVPLADLLPYFSYSRYSFEYLLSSELKAFPPIFHYEVSALFDVFNFSVDTPVEIDCLIPLALYGLFYRVLTLGSLYTMRRSETTFQYLEKVYRPWRVVLLVVRYFLFFFIFCSFAAKAILALFSFERTQAQFSYSDVNFLLSLQGTDVIVSVCCAVFSFIYLYQCTKSWIPAAAQTLYWMLSIILNIFCMFRVSDLSIKLNAGGAAVCFVVCLVVNICKERVKD